MLPLLVLLCLATVDLGRWLTASVGLANATRVAADRAATKLFTNYTRTYWETLVRSSFNSEIVHLGSAVSSPSMTIATTLDSTPLYRIRLQSRCDVKPIIRWPFLPATVTIRYETTIRQYR